MSELVKTAAREPVTVLIAALGGEGGGVLTEWLVDAAMAADLPVQSISTPGVAQRTGATTYYVEIYPETHSSLGGRRPVLALYPSPGAVDVMIASELLEAGRAMELGYVSPERTVLIAATHRVYAVVEKSAMTDGRFDSERVLRAAREMPAKAVLFDLSRRPETRSLILNSVLFGAMAASGKLPIPLDGFRDAIRRSGKMVEANLKAFDHGVELATRGVPEDAPAPAATLDLPRRPRDLQQLVDEAARVFPAEAIRTIEIGLERTAGWQNLKYARRYLERLTPIHEAERQAGGDAFPVTAETARRLALWMAYEDLVRVADLKSRADRFEKIRAEVRAKPEEPVHTREFFKPGIDEVAALMPRFLGRPIRNWAERRRLVGRLHMPLRLKTNGIFGFTLMWTLARMRWLRPVGLRYGEEQAAIDGWLEAIRRFTGPAPHLALEIARLPRLIKGYSDTHRRGLASFRAIWDRLVAPLLAGKETDFQAADLDDAAARIAASRQAALSDPDGDALDRTLAPEAQSLRIAAE